MWLFADDTALIIKTKSLGNLDTIQWYSIVLWVGYSRTLLDRVLFGEKSYQVNL